jgi:hypothetical protein
MAGDPQLDCLTLTCGDAQALLIDPRDQGDRLASRYCQGGWVLDWRVGDRSLTDRPTDDFDPAIGQGLPEVFETGLGWGVAPVGGSYLRIGVGRCTRVDDGWCSNGTLAEPVEWSVAVDGTAEETSEAIFTCRDELTIGNRHFGYELERRITLQESGLISASTLTLQVPWSEPVAWFSHPFVPQHRGDATRIQLPGGARNLPELSEDGGFGCPASGARPGPSSSASMAVAAWPWSWTAPSTRPWSMPPSGPVPSSPTGAVPGPAVSVRAGP